MHCGHNAQPVRYDRAVRTGTATNERETMSQNECQYSERSSAVFAAQCCDNGCGCADCAKIRKAAQS